MSYMSIHASFPLYTQDLNISIKGIGTIFSAHPLASILFSIPLAIISDKLNRKIVLIIGLFLSILVAVTLLIAHNAVDLTMAKILESTSIAAFLSGITAYISDISEKNNLAENIGKLQ